MQIYNNNKPVSINVKVLTFFHRKCLKSNDFVQFADVFNPMAPPPVTGMQVQFQPMIQQVMPTIENAPSLEQQQQTQNHFHAQMQGTSINQTLPTIQQQLIDSNQQKLNGMPFTSQASQITHFPPPQVRCFSIEFHLQNV